MFAVIQAGGHQYKVSQGDELSVDFIEGKKEGDTVTFDSVLLVGGDKTVLGKPYIQGAKVEATVKKQSFDPKIIVFKFKRRKDYKRTRGHKQPITVLEIGKISH